MEAMFILLLVLGIAGIGYAVYAKTKGKEQKKSDEIYPFW